MTRKWLKRIGWVVATPIFFFMLLILLLYIPPVQNFLRGKVVTYATEATGMQINIQRIDLRFPLNLLVRGVEVVQTADTLLTLESLNVRVQLLPLLNGKVDIDNFTLKGTTINTLNLIDGMQLKGDVKELSLSSRGVDLNNQTVLINSFDIEAGRITLCLNDTAETATDSVSTPLNWKIMLKELNVKDLSFSLQIPTDTMYIDAYLEETEARNISTDLAEQLYELKELQVKGASVKYDVALSLPAQGFDPSHIELSDIALEIDSVKYKGQEIKANLNAFSMKERSGLEITSGNGRFLSDSLNLSLPSLSLQTPYSKIDAKIRFPWNPGSNRRSNIEVSVSATLGKQDILTFLTNLSEGQQSHFPSEPLDIELGASGSPDTLTVHTIKATLPGAFTIDGSGALKNLASSATRWADAQLEMKTGNLQFLTALADSTSGRTFTIPEGIDVKAVMGVRGTQYNANLSATESNGLLQIDATFDEKEQTYSARLHVDSLHINRFMPKEPIGILTVNAQAEGKGIDFASPASYATATLVLDTLQYARHELSNVNLTAKLENGMISAGLNSNNELLTAEAKGTYRLNQPYTEATADINVKDVNLYKLGIMADLLHEPLSFAVQAKTSQDSVRINLRSGDLSAGFRSRTPLEAIMKESTAFSNILMRQVEKKQLNHAELRRNLPSGVLFFNSGKENPLATILKTKNIQYDEIRVGFMATPQRGINGRGTIHQLQIDTLQLDSIYFATHQDTTRLRLRAGVENKSDNPQFTFKAAVTGEVRTDDAELTLEYLNDKGETGLLFGINARPEKDGIQFQLIPENPVVAFRHFSFNGQNSVFLQNDLRMQANVEMLDSLGMGLRVHSVPDSVNLQNLDVEIRRIELGDFNRILPYLADISGVFSLEANYRRTDKAIQVSTQMHINDFTYTGTRIGNLGIGATWLPDNEKQYIDAYLSNDDKEILSASGHYDSSKDALQVESSLHHFPLDISKAFLPAGLLELTGDADGSFGIAGSTSSPKIDGELTMHGVRINSYKYGIHVKPEERSLKIQNSKIVFDKYAIYSDSGGDNPFTINGHIDLADLNKPYADISLSARNYPLLNAKRSKVTEVYGRAFIDLNSTVRGPLNALLMRGNLNVLNNTDITYILRDSPLTVQDRLGDLVEFTSFADSVSDEKKESAPPTFGGMSISLAINIEPSVKMGVDLSEDRSSYIKLEGGGTLSFVYTPQGTMSMTGRYEFSDGTVRYALPVIPLKEFGITNDSYVEWTGDPMNPSLNIKASERMRGSVANEDKGKTMKNFDVSIIIKNRLSSPALTFDLASPDDSDIQDELNAMDAEERGKQAIAMMVTGIYMARGSGDSFNMGSALNSLLQSQISSIAGSALKSVNITLGMDSYDDGSGSTRTDYSFRYSQRLFNDRVQIVIGGRVSTGGDELTRNESFIDNVSLEYRLDASGTRYLRLFHNKSENLLDGEVTDTGVGIVLRKKVSKLGELFIFRRKEKKDE